MVVDEFFARWARKTFQHAGAEADMRPVGVTVLSGEGDSAASFLIRFVGAIGAFYLLADLDAQVIRAIRPHRVRVYGPQHGHVIRPVSEFLTRHGFGSQIA
jgi:hypothetical protein